MGTGAVARLRVCAEPGCPNLTPTGSRCPEHRPWRPSAHKRGYGARWQRTRTRVLRSHPDCDLCGRPATQVHHIDGQGPNSPNGHNPSNLQPLCHSCHSRITATAASD